VSAGTSSVTETASRKCARTCPRPRKFYHLLGVLNRL
jgi:hypothetical protein